MVMTATPSAPTSSSVLPLVAIAAAIDCYDGSNLLFSFRVAVMACWELEAGKATSTSTVMTGVRHQEAIAWRRRISSCCIYLRFRCPVGPKPEFVLWARGRCV
jgi:hypothetical protein